MAMFHIGGSYKKAATSCTMWLPSFFMELSKLLLWPGRDVDRVAIEPVESETLEGRSFKITFVFVFQNKDTRFLAQQIGIVGICSPVHASDVACLRDIRGQLIQLATNSENSSGRIAKRNQCLSSGVSGIKHDG